GPLVVFLNRYRQKGRNVAVESLARTDPNEQSAIRELIYRHSQLGGGSGDVREALEEYLSQPRPVAIPGGIALDPSQLKIYSQKGAGALGTSTGTPMETTASFPLEIDGLIPVIINITPVSNPLLLLGNHQKDEGMPLGSVIR
ncbi:MAG: hypothetical protein NUV91_09735, partial [Candidatus Omnitrophica bacterium]|nr:hypothetical protein [Candidatus Omnitrophota bacterium]